MAFAFTSSARAGQRPAVRVAARAHVALALAALGLAFSTPARAQSSSERALAEALFQEGRRLMDAGDPKRACTKFDESQRIEPALGTVLNLAACYEALTKTASAWAEYARALALAERLGDGARAAFAENKVKALDGTLARVTLHTDQPREHLQVTIDGNSVQSGAWGSPLPLDPGVHRLRVTAPGRVPWEKHLELQPGASSVVLRVPELRRAAGPREAGSTTFASALPVWMWTSLGVSAASIATGTIATIDLHQQRTQVRQHCRGEYCNAVGLAAHNGARTSAMVADVAFGVGALALIAAGYLWYTTPSSTEPSVALAPAFLNDAVLLGASGRY